MSTCSTVRVSSPAVSSCPAWGGDRLAQLRDRGRLGLHGDLVGGGEDDLEVVAKVVAQQPVDHLHVSLVAALVGDIRVDGKAVLPAVALVGDPPVEELAGAGGGPPGHDASVVLAPGRPAVEPLGLAGGALGDDEVVERLAEHRLAVVAEHLLERGVDCPDDRGGVDQLDLDDRVSDQVEEVAEPLLRSGLPVGHRHPTPASRTVSGGETQRCPDILVCTSRNST